MTVPAPNQPGPTEDGPGSKAFETSEWAFGESDCYQETHNEEAAPKEGDRLGDFELISLLGRGGMGKVFRARVIGTERELAVKVLLSAQVTPEKLERFRREGQITAALKHPGIVVVHSAGVADGCPYLAYELVEGARELSEAWGDSYEERASRVRDVAHAVGAAHAQQIVHRDLKPANVLVDAHGRVRVADFGLAHLASMERLTVSGQFLGTPIYMGPEQATGALASPRMDVWSLGVLLYEACCKEVPFEARSLVQLMGQLSIGNYERPTVHTPSLPASFVSVIDKALAKAPADRYPDGQAFAADLDLALAGEFTQAQAEAKLSRWARIVSRVRAAPFSSLAVIVAVAAVGSSLAYRAPAARPSIEDAPAVPALRADVAAVETVGEVVAAGRALDELVPSELGSEWLSRLRERAVEAEDPMSQMRLADYFALGRRGVSRNLEAARALYRALIAGGEREAFSRLGTLELTEGNGAEACALFEQGAERGDASAWLGLGRLYEAGSGGVRLDLARARECYGLARQQRSQVGAAEFGRCLVRGVGGSREPARGMEILHTAFRGREGAKWASAYLGRILLTGAPGVPADRPKALVFLQQAFAKGYPDPRLGLELGQEFQRDGSRVLAIDTLASAYAQGVPEAGVELALVLTSGEPTVEEQRRALELLEAATTAGTPGAAEGLSRLLDSVFADEALRVLKRLAEAGDPDARATLSLREGSPR